MSQLVVFLDDGGVMNDNSQRALQWQRLVSEFFVPLLGGTPDAWIEANRVVIDHILDLENWRTRIFKRREIFLSGTVTSGILVWLSTTSFQVICKNKFVPRE